MPSKAVPKTREEKNGNPCAFSNPAHPASNAVDARNTDRIAFVLSPNRRAVDLIPTIASSRLSWWAYAVSYTNVHRMPDAYKGPQTGQLTAPVTADQPRRAPQLKVSPVNQIQKRSFEFERIHYQARAVASV
jgi:hypothetical protein